MLDINICRRWQSTRSGSALFPFSIQQGERDSSTRPPLPLRMSLLQWTGERRESLLPSRIKLVLPLCYFIIICLVCFLNRKRLRNMVKDNSLFLADYCTNYIIWLKVREKWKALEIAGSMRCMLGVRHNGFDRGTTSEEWKESD